jgi:uroporphyrinogen decarboxylase
VGPDVPIIWTFFSPLMVARYLLAGEAAQLLEIARSEPSSLAAGLEAITQTLAEYVRACIRSGADGVFYATNLATRGQLRAEDCGAFQRPYELAVLVAAAGAPFNVMHVCGQDALFDEFAEYPVAAFSWALVPGNPTLAEGHRRTGKASMGGVPNKLAGTSAADVAQRVRSALDDMHGRWLLVAPDCSIDIATPEDLLLAARDATR